MCLYISKENHRANRKIIRDENNGSTTKTENSLKILIYWGVKCKQAEQMSISLKYDYLLKVKIRTIETNEQKWKRVFFLFSLFSTLKLFGFFFFF